MSVLGIDQITYAADDLATCRTLFRGLGPDAEVRRRRRNSSSNASTAARWWSRRCDEPGAAARHAKKARPCAKWCGASRAKPNSRAMPRRIARTPGFVDGEVDGARRIGCIDPNGLAVRVAGQPQACGRGRLRRDEHLERQAAHQPGRAGLRTRDADRSRPRGVLRRTDVEDHEQLLSANARLRRLRQLSEPRRLHALRAEGGHHDLFLLQLPDRQARTEPRGLHRARHPRGVRRRPALLAPRLGNATRARAAIRCPRPTSGTSRIRPAA